MFFLVCCPWNSCPVVWYLLLECQLFPWQLQHTSQTHPSSKTSVVFPRNDQWLNNHIDSLKENTETTCNCLLFSCQSSVIIFSTNQKEPSINLLPVDNLDLCYRNWMKQSTFLGLLNRSEFSQKCLKSAHQGGVVKNSEQTLPGKFQFPKASFALRNLLQRRTPGIS